MHYRFREPRQLPIPITGQFEWVGALGTAAASIAETIAGTPKQEERKAQAELAAAKLELQKAVVQQQTAQLLSGKAGGIGQAGPLGIPWVAWIAGGGLLIWGLMS